MSRKWICDFCTKEKTRIEPTEVDLELDVTLEWDWLKKHRMDLWIQLHSISRRGQQLQRRLRTVKKEATKTKYVK